MIQISWSNKRVTPPAPVELSLEKEIYPMGGGREDSSMGKLIYGDNFIVLSSLLESHSEKVDLVYIDPPFFTNRKFTTRVGKGEDSRKPKDWLLDTGYGDTWADLDEYIQFLYERIRLAYQLLSPTGSLYLHLDWHADAYARLLLDEIFGADRLLNEIIWTYHGPSPIRSAFNRKHDTILLYTKSEVYTFNADDVRTEYNQNTVKTFNSSTKAGFGKVPDLARGKVPEDWWYFPVVARLHSERTGYPTQKPEKLIERVIRASSNPGDLVLDFFSGSGTTALVAARHGRHFIGVDASEKAIQISEERLTRFGNPKFEIWSTRNLENRIKESNNLVRSDTDSVYLLNDENVFYWEVGELNASGIYISHNQRTRPYRADHIEKTMLVPATILNVVVRVTLMNNVVLQQIIGRRPV